MNHSPHPLTPVTDDAFGANAVHVMTFSAADAQAALAAVREELAAGGAQLSSLSLNTISEVVGGALRLTNLSCAEARACADRLAGRPGVLGARVEHHLYRA
jgi:hypothetical protein